VGWGEATYIAGASNTTTVYRVYHMFGDDIATYVSLNLLEISQFPLDMMYPYWRTTHMQKMSPLSM
jgi:hypothetical protein